MRHESDRCEALKTIGLAMARIDAEDIFLNTPTTGRIDGRTVGLNIKTTDPETKRRIIGDVFYHLISSTIRKAIDLDETFIAQGTPCGRISSKAATPRHQRHRPHH